MSKKDLEINELYTAKEFYEALQANFKESKSKEVRTLAESEQLTRLFLKAFIEALQTALSEGKRVQLPSFGSFSTRYRPARKFTSPSNGAETTAPEHVNVHFSVASHFKTSAANKALIAAHSKAHKASAKK